MDADFLKDIIPYRCPKCGDSRKFTTLRDLKLHLNAEHAFKVGCVKPRTRTSIFDHKVHNSKKKASNHENLSRQWSSSLDSRRSSSESYGRDSPLFQSYKEDARMLERRLENARTFEYNNNRRGDNLSRSHSYDPLNRALDKLNKDVMSTRRNNWQSTDALYNAEEVMNGVETAAEERFQNQQNIIQNLVDHLQQREMQLTSANRDLERIRNDRDKLMNEIEDIFKSADFGNKKLLHELDTKEQELNSVNNELIYLKKKSSEEMKQKDEKLMEAERTLRQLEQERKALEDERENLMDKVQTDSGILRKTLEMKENQVRKLNVELEAMKQEQEEMLSESMELYHTADKGTSKLKDMVKLRDKQLQEAEEELDRLKQLNERLVWESRQLTEQADSHSQILHELLRQRENELASVKQELQSVLQSDKPKTVNQQIHDLQQIIVEKTALLEQKENELQSLKTFLKTTAEKEAVAREKLEKFITDLIDRADKAEKDLDCLKKYITDRKSKNDAGRKDDGKLKGYTESCDEDVDSDDEMSDDLEVSGKQKPLISKSTIIKREAPVKKNKSGYHAKTNYQPTDSTGKFLYSPSPCDSGYQDSKLASPKSTFHSSSVKHPDYRNDINLRAKFTNNPSSPTRDLHTESELNDRNFERNKSLPDTSVENPKNYSLSPKTFDSYPDFNQDLPKRAHRRPVNSLPHVNHNLPYRYSDVAGPHGTVNNGKQNDSHRNKISSPDRIAYFPYDRLMGQSVENLQCQAEYPFKNKYLNRKCKSSDDLLSPDQFYQDPGPSQQNSRSFSISEYQDLPTKSMPTTYIHGRSSDHGPTFSSSERQVLPKRNPGYGRSISSTDRQKLPGQREDNSLSDVVSITDYDPMQSENSFQKIMDENGILWEAETPNTEAAPRSKFGKTYNAEENKPGGYKSQQSHPKLKMSEKFVEERKLFSENLKKIMKLPFLRESATQAELSEDTLRFKLGKDNFIGNKNNLYENDIDGKQHSQSVFSVDSNDRNFETEITTKDSSTQTWIIDRGLMDAETSTPESSSPIMIDKTSSTSDFSHKVNTKKPVNVETATHTSKQNDRNLVDSDPNSSTSYSNLPQKKTVSKNSYETKINERVNSPVPTFTDNKLSNQRQLGMQNLSNKVDKPRDLFDELKQESLNAAILTPTQVQNSGRVRDSMNNLETNARQTREPVKLVSNGLDNSENLKPAKSVSSFNRLDNSGGLCLKPAKSVPSLYDQENYQNQRPANSVPSSNDLKSCTVSNSQNKNIVTSSPIFNQKATANKSGCDIFDGDVMLLSKPQATISAQPSNKFDKQGWQLESNNKSPVLSSQMTEDFEVVETPTEEEVDSVIYDKSMDSIFSNSGNGGNNSVTIISDTLGDFSEDILPPQEETLITSDRRKSLSRQLSVDVGRNSGKGLHEQIEGTEPLGLMVEETLTPESLDKTFFAQPETEMEDDYQQSISSMDGFTLSRTSSQDSLISERMLHYSKREVTRKRRQALLHIFSFLDVASLINAAIVCREWKKISRHPSLWKHVYLRNEKCSNEFLLNIAKWCNSMETLHLEGIKTRDRKKFETDEEYNTRTRAILEPGLEKLLQVSESTLKTASIIHCENIITDKGLWLVSCYSRMVRKVTYICNTDLPGADVIWALGAGCRDIKYLNITSSEPSSAVSVKFNNKCLQVISQFCQDLQTLCIGGTEIDINGLVLIAKNCQRLTRLEIHYGTMVTEDTMVAVCRIGLHNLQHIFFNFTPVEAKAILQLCKSSKHLQRIQISLDISCFDLKAEYKEDDKLKKYADLVKHLKELEKKPGVGNILKLSCGEVFINTEKKFFGLF